MRGAPLCRVCFVLAAVPSALAQHGGRASPDLGITPAIVSVGAPELIRLRAPHAAAVEGEWLGHKVMFFRSGADWVALAGADVETPAGPSALTVHVRDAKGMVRDFSRTVDLHEAHYRTGTLTVDPKFVEPAPEDRKRIEEEGKLKQKIFAASAARPLWKGNFRAPVTARPTDSFGTRRMFNGKLASIHKGADSRAPLGTPVRASNSGVVVLARPLYYEGNCVIIDHGLGLFTLSMHFSRIDVREGQHVAKGDVLGLSGATGRTTGPHLHWAVRWEDAYLDPVKLLRMNLKSVR